MKYVYAIMAMAMCLVLTGCKGKPQLLDEQHKTFYVNGVSAADGVEAIVKSLEDIGFKKDGKEEECDLTAVGGSLTYYVNYRAKDLTKGQISKLTGGLYDNLPNDIDLTKFGGCRVFLTWYQDGSMCSAVIEVGEFADIPSEDVIEVNKRLSEMFPKSKIGNRANGYKVYYTDYGVGAYYTNGLSIEYSLNEK